jgi:hypothetical protein
MKIIDTNKRIDYYDYISNVYGVDPLIIFKRIPELPIQQKEFIGNPQFYFDDYTYNYRYIPDRYFVDKYNLKEGDHFQKKLLVVCGYIYPILHVRDEYHLATQEEIDGSYRKTKDTFWMRRSNFNQQDLNKKHEFLIDISKDILQPIYIIERIYTTKAYSGKYTIQFDTNNVLLKDIIGFTKTKDPKELYQEISQYISLHYNSNNPPVEINNKEKIIKSGFDLKKSFRHRK